MPAIGNIAGPVGKREVAYCVSGVGEMDVSDPETWVCTGSNATTIDGLKHDLRGNPCIPNKFHVCVAMPSSSPEKGTVSWMTETAMKKRSPELPQGALQVYVLPYS